MNKPAPKTKTKKKSPSSSKSGGVRKIGYIVAIIVMFVMLYIIKHLRQWGVTFLTEEFDRCIFYIQLSIYASIIAQVLFLLYDNRWFKHLVKGITNIAGALALIMIYVIFPFQISSPSGVKWTKIGLLILFGFTVISIIVELVKGFRYLAKDPQAE